MFNILKKAVLMLLIVCLICQMGACVNKKDRGDTISTDVDLNQGTIISKEPIEFSFFYNASKEPDGEWLVFKEAAKMTNVSVHVTLSKSNSDFNQAFNLMLSSGEMADLVMGYSPIAFTKYGAEGAFVPLNEYIDQYAPNIKRVLEERPEVKKNITSFDGNIYYIPHIPGGTVSTGWFIRNDWLKTLGLKAPETTEELYDTLVAFRNNDPNGNGIKDEIPYFNGAMTSGNFSGLECLYYLWNAFPSWYSDNGVVKYGPYEPNFKEAMMNLAQWYEEDLIDKEIFTRGSKARDKLLGDNVGGSTHDWFGSTALFNEKYKKLLRVLNFSLLHHLTELNLTIDPYLPHMAGQSVPVAKILFRRLNILISGLVKRAQG